MCPVSVDTTYPKSEGGDIFGFELASQVAIEDCSLRSVCVKGRDDTSKQLRIELLASAVRAACASGLEPGYKRERVYGISVMSARTRV